MISDGAESKGALTGYPAKNPANSTEDNKRAIQRENESAVILSQNGYNVEQNPSVPGNKKPDFKINGEVFDNVAPTTSNVRNVYDRVREKVSSGQTNSVVINMADTEVTIDELKQQFIDWPMDGLDKVIAIDKSGMPVIIK
ncbi:hypothetical protein CRQ46_24580 [Salmonella enterica]|nr:hypothetical protein [Salmonella enterica]